jgi:site-specific recombinase XerD
MITPQILGGFPMQQYIESFLEMIAIRGLSDNTLKSYKSYVKSYLSYVETYLQKLPDDVSWEELRTYTSFLKRSKGLSDRSINAHISMIRFFTEYVLHKPWDRYQLPFRKFDKYLPSVPSQDEARHFIDTLPNLKHKAIVAVIYSAGLRVGEVCNLRYSDVSRKDMRIRIAPSKNRSERFAILSKNALDILTQYWHIYGKPRGWLFPSTRNNGARPIVSFTVNRIVNDHIDRLGWSQELNCHSFRHGFGTHLYENGVDLLTIQRLLGHNSINSTTIYVHLASHRNGTVKSPFDFAGTANE